MSQRLLDGRPGRRQGIHHEWMGLNKPAGLFDQGNQGGAVALKNLAWPQVVRRLL